MSRNTVRAFITVLVAVLALLLASCVSLIPGVSPPPPRPEEEPALANYTPVDLSQDPFPLFVGARWVYRNATPDINPEIHSGASIETEVVATVRRVGLSAGVPYECFVLRTRQETSPDVLSYLHRTPNGVDLYGMALLPYAGAPVLTSFSGEPYLNFPLQKGNTWSFARNDGSALNATVLSQSTIPLCSTVLTLLGPYTSSFAEAWRVKWEFAGLLADAYGQGIVEEWLAPGTGRVRRTAGSLVYELMQFRARDEVMQLNEASMEKRYYPEAGTVVVVQLRGTKPSASSGYAWDVENWDEITSAGVLSPLSEGGESGEFYADLDNTGQVETGTYVFSFEVRTQGNASLVFTRRGFGAAAAATPESLRFDFGRNQPISLSNGSVHTFVTLAGATATFAVHYTDGDGNEPTVRKVVLDAQTTHETTHDMVFSKGKLADGYYTSGPVRVAKGLHTYCFKFSDDRDASADLLPCELGATFDIGGPSPPAQADLERP
jgi:hypothetical protein